MALSSIELVKECRRRGMLSKEAAVRIMARRDRLIKEAISRGMFSILRGTPEAVAAPVAKTGVIKGLLERFGKGGLSTAEKGPAGAAGWSDVTSNLAKMMALAGMTAGATAGVGAMMRHSKDKQLGREIEGSYKAMFEEVPDLKDANPELVRKQFNIMAKYAPALAAEPVVAGTWVRDSVERHPYIGPNEIKELAEIQQRIDESRERKPFAYDKGITGMVQKSMGG